MPRIALTGGIASGKTLVSDTLAGLGAEVIDSDLLAREAVEPGSVGLQRVLERFGESVLRPDGSLDRTALGRLVFSDDAAREDLNAIVHPLVRERAAELVAAAPPGAVVVNVIPLLVETGQEDDFEGVVVVDVPVEEQVSRLVHRNDLTTEEARARVRAQAPRGERLRVADWVVDNSGDEATTLAQVQRLWEGPLAQLRRREEARGDFAGLPPGVRGPEPTDDARALQAFVEAQQHATGDQDFDPRDVWEHLASARVLSSRGAIVGAVMVSFQQGTAEVYGPWSTPALRDVARPVLLEAALAQGPRA